MKIARKMDVKITEASVYMIESSRVQYAINEKCFHTWNLHVVLTC